MSNIGKKIQEEAERLPENLANQTYDFICFLESQHGIKPLAQDDAQESNDWKDFFKRHIRSIEGYTPLGRDEIYAESL